MAACFVNFSCIFLGTNVSPKVDCAPTCMKLIKRNKCTITAELHKQEPKHVAVGPGNAHFISIRQMSSDPATLRRGKCRHAAQCGSRIHAAAVAAAADTVVYRHL